MRNKFTTAILALALALTTITSATAMPVEQTTDTDTEPTVTVQNKDDGIAVHDAGSNVYEVALKWDDPTFTFVPKQQIEKVWNAETHHYEYTSSVEDFVITDGEWDKTTATATVTNDSSVPMTVSSSLFAAADSTSAVQSYKLSSESDLAISLSGSEEAIIKNAGTKTVTCSLSGSDVAGYFAATGATTAVTGRWIFTFEMSEPIMAEKDTWYKGTTAKSTITSINVVSSYQPTGNETESWDASAAGDGSVMAYLNGTELTIAGNDSGMVFMNPNAYSAFASFTALTTVTNADVFDTSRTTSMAGLFNNCKALTTVNGLEKWDTSLVTSMSGLFLYCGELTSVDLTNWKTPSLQHMSHMFLDNMKLTSVGDLSGWDTSNVLEMTNMFYRCFALTGTGDISEWDTSKVTNMSRMFAMIGNNSGLSELDLSGWDTSSVTNMTSMFLGCEKLEVLNMANWDTTNVTKHDTKFNNVPLLREVTLGPKYTLVAELPSPSGDGFDGKWHDTVSGEAYTVEELANVTRTEAVTYTAFPDLTGTWLWNETIEMPDYTAEDTLLPLNGTAEIPVKFTSNGGKQYETVNLRSIPFTMNYGMADGTSDDAYAQLRTNKWSNSAMRVFSFSEPFKYSTNPAFYFWFLKNAEIANPLSGTWVWNESLDSKTPFCTADNANIPASFSCNQIEYSNFYFEKPVSSLLIISYEDSGATSLRVYSPQKWSNENYRTITFVEPFEPTSNAAFYAWFKENATKKPALEGTWKFNETLTVPPATIQGISGKAHASFTGAAGQSGNTSYTGFVIPDGYSYAYCNFQFDGTPPLAVYQWKDDDDIVNRWYDQSYRYITFADAFEYSTNPTFYDWFIENAVKQTSSTATLAAADGWYKGETDKSVITSLSIVDSYVPSGAETEVWDASADGNGNVMAYLNGTELTLAGNGEGHIEANEDSSYAFADFSSVTSVQGLDLLDTSKVTDMTGMFQNSFTSDTNFVAAGTEGIASFEVSPAYVVSTLPIDLRSWDVSGVTSMSNMFSGVSATSINITGWDYENLENADGIFNGCADVRVIYLGDFDVGYGCSTEGIFDGTLAGKTGPTVYVASTDVKNTLVSRNDLQENTDEMWDDNLNPSQIVVNASAGRSSNTQVMMLIPNRTELYEYAA